MAPAENHLIVLLPRRERMSLLAACETVPLELGAVLCEAGEPTRHVYFPNSCTLSLISTIDDELGLEVGMVGQEGMLGAQLVLGVSAIPLRALVQGSGTACRVGAAPFRRELAQSKALQLALNRYVYVLMNQLARSVACKRFHPSSRDSHAGCR